MSDAAAPIAVFLYNRPEHTRACLESLAANPGFTASPLYLFCDGPRDDADRPAVTAVRRIAHEVEHPAMVIVDSSTNLGLATSIIAGVTQVVDAHGRVIVVEDDLQLSPSFLDFMNRALRRYQNEPRVMQIAGHVVPVPFATPDDALFLTLASSWGWATWSRAWVQFDPAMTHYDTLAGDPARRRHFDLGGALPNFSFLTRQRHGRLDSWWIRWYLSVFMADGLVLYPRESLVHNHGFDGTGRHCGRGGSPYDAPGAPYAGALTRLPATVRVDATALAQVSAFMASRNTFWQRARRRLIDLLGD